MSELFYPLGVFRGEVAQRYGLKTAIDKSPVQGEVYLTENGLEGDHCADQRVHGGPERALHQYPVEHYDHWRERYGDAFQGCAPGMGENLSTCGMTEDNVCLGDRYRWGEAIIEVSQPRSPCFKLSRRWEIEGFSAVMQEISRCGWLYRVIQSGTVSVDQPLQLIERQPDAMTVREVCEAFFGDPLNADGLNRLLSQQPLSESWMKKVRSRLETGELENWNFRLLGHA